MNKRLFWQKKIEGYLSQKSILWLTGVRRAGKTVLCQSLPDAIYFDCELPRIRQLMEEPQSFLEQMQGKEIILDEIHRLPNPAELLKIAADHFPQIKIVATGSSSLGASGKFKDTLTGRKNELWLTPMILSDLNDFGRKDLKHRLFFGGLPPFFLSEQYPEKEFQEWIDALWAKDIQELFRLERRYSFQKFFELLLVQSGSIFEASRFATPCEVSRMTISNYLKVMEATFVAQIIRPYSTNPSSEIISAPKVYGFDTGFVCYFKGWQDLRKEDMGFLFEHFVLNELFAQLQIRDILYWRDKQGHEIDFILKDRRSVLSAIECKWKAADFDPANMRIFAGHYPHANFYVVGQDVDRPYKRRFAKNIVVNFCNVSDLAALFQSLPAISETEKRRGKRLIS